MKVAIITEFNLLSVNFGSYLQTCALNTYLTTRYPQHHFETLLLDNNQKRLRTFYWPGIIKSIVRRLTGRGSKKGQTILYPALENRLKKFRFFMEKNIIVSKEHYDWDKLQQSDYDLFLVGSDVVWRQGHSGVNRIKYLDFQNRKHAVKAAYAASFGRDWIPKENEKATRRYLKQLKAISVREQSSIELLKEIGIRNVAHALDPTLIIDKYVWESMENLPLLAEEQDKRIVGGEYLFVYLLGSDEKQRKDIVDLSKRENLKIVTVPYACGRWNAFDQEFGDVIVLDCAPQEWIWLIHRAKYVITDSFHGIVFSTIFEKKFFAITRYYEIDINNRLEDFLKTIGQQDKMVDISRIQFMELFQWNYRDIEKKLDEKIQISRQFLDNLLSNR